ncbi:MULTISPECIES: hypothetical protein [unclassified Aureimonas]|uniref:hypothetical protein n=1 Tax=unclassified Aureimonas TaxID=2615206 RepID=UPI000A9A5CDC|nr:MULTISPECIES: hypothetical protein [unclassified Aureimonas]
MTDATPPLPRKPAPANGDVDPVQHALEMHGGDDRATIAALLTAYFDATDEVERLRRALAVQNASTSYGYDRGHLGALTP